MKAVILAAGKGTRLRPLTDTIPKPMVRVLGRPLLEYTLSALPACVDEAVIAVGYRKEVICEHFDGAFNGRTVRYVHQDKPKGTFHALAAAQAFLSDEPF